MTITRWFAALVLVLATGCAPGSSDPPAAKTVRSDVYRVDVEGARCVVAESYQAVGVDCDWR